MEKTAQRIGEIDALRGLALVLMIIYHFLYDLNVFFQVDIAYNQGLIFYTGKAAAVLFILVAGISCAFSRDNTTRGVKLIIWGFVIFTVTSIAVPGSNIVFGILQFLGVCFLLYPAVKNISPYLLVPAGALIILGGEYTPRVDIGTNWLVPLGLWGPDFSSVDYFPLVPWFGVFLLGIAWRKMVYRQNRSLLPKPLALLKPLAAVGKHTLIVYLVHQPLLLAALYVVFRCRDILA